MNTLVRDLAKELGVSNKQIIAALGDDTKTQASKLTAKEVEIVKNKFATTVETEPEVKPEKIVKPVEPRKFQADDAIPCRSVTAGELILIGKSGTYYSWAGVGQVIDVRYDDIVQLKFARSSQLYFPRFIIEDEELLADPKFADVKALYDKIYSADIEELLSLPNEQFIEVLSKAPTGLKNALKVTVATRFEEGTFDSLQKIQAVEQICGAEILNLK